MLRRIKINEKGKACLRLCPGYVRLQLALVTIVNRLRNRFLFEPYQAPSLRLSQKQPTLCPYQQDPRCQDKPACKHNPCCRKYVRSDHISLMARLRIFFIYYRNAFARLIMGCSVYLIHKRALGYNFQKPFSGGGRSRI